VKAVRCYQVIGSSRVGGAEKVALGIQRYAKEIKGKGGKIIGPAGGASEDAVQKSGFEYISYYHSALLSRSRVRTALAGFLFMLKAWETRGQVFHFHCPFVYGALHAWMRLLHTKKILHLHLAFSPAELTWPLSHAPDVVLLCAGYIRSAVEQAMPNRHLNSTRIRVLPNAIDLNRFHTRNFSSDGGQVRSEPKEISLIMVANLAPHKGQATAIKVVQSLARRGFSPRLMLVGEERTDIPDYTTYLKKLAGTLGVEQQVEFLGFRDDVPDLLKAADFLLLPSTMEGMPLCILEAQASGVIVLAAPTAGIPEIVEHGVTGFLITASDHDAYAEMIAKLAKDTALQIRIAETALKRVLVQGDLERYHAHIFQEYEKMMNCA
jgi:glycosyltransferase involved in cell wall biosynthesis